jgi:hypothetical protein
MEELLNILLGVIKDTPQIVDAVKAALTKEGYTAAEIEAIFAEVIDYDALGILPNHPVKPEPALAVQPGITDRPAPVPTAQAHINARSQEQTETLQDAAAAAAESLKPSMSTAAPGVRNYSDPFVKAR